MIFFIGGKEKLLLENLKYRLIPPTDKSVNLVIKVDPKYLNFVYMVIDGHGRLALPRTRAGKEGLLDLIISPDFVEDVLSILEYIKKNYDPSLEIVEELGDNWMIAVN